MMRDEELVALILKLQEIRAHIGKLALFNRGFYINF